MIESHSATVDKFSVFSINNALKIYMFYKPERKQTMPICRRQTSCGSLQGWRASNIQIAMGTDLFAHSEGLQPCDGSAQDQGVDIMSTFICVDSL